MKLLYLDLETTGTLFWKHGIHQIAGIIEIDGKEAERFDFKVQPNQKCLIEQDALDIVGVTEEQIKQYMPMGIIYHALINVLSKYVDKYQKNDKFFIVGYNTQAFDAPFLRAWFKQNNDEYFGSWFWSVTIDVMILAQKKLMKDRATMKSFSLTDVAAHLGIPIDGIKLHDAMADIELTKKVYEFICLNK